LVLNATPLAAEGFSMSRKPTCHSPSSPLKRGNLILQEEGKFHFFYRKLIASWLPPLKGRESNAFEDQTVELGKRGMGIAQTLVLRTTSKVVVLYWQRLCS